MVVTSTGGPGPHPRGLRGMLFTRPHYDMRWFQRRQSPQVLIRATPGTVCSVCGLPPKRGARAKTQQTPHVKPCALVATLAWRHVPFARSYRSTRGLTAVSLLRGCDWTLDSIFSVLRRNFFPSKGRIRNGCASLGLLVDFAL